MTISSIGGSIAASQAQGVASGNGVADPAAFGKILDAFRKEAAKTPAERARDDVLKKHNLTENDYKALPSDQKKAIDAEIATAVQRVMRADKGKGFKGAETAATVIPGNASGMTGFLSA
jgi:hypothetical protein